MNEEVRTKTIAPAGPAGTAIEPTGERDVAAVEGARVREFLGFRLGAERYGLALRSIREILKVPPITEVPRAPAPSAPHRAASSRPRMNCFAPLLQCTTYCASGSNCSAGPGALARGLGFLTTVFFAILPP